MANLFYFFRNPLLLATIFDDIASMKYWTNIKINSSGKVIDSCLKDFKTTLHAFYARNTLINKIRL